MQYENYCNTKEVLKAVKSGNKECLIHNLSPQGALPLFDHSLKQLKGIWYGVQSNLNVNIFSISIKYQNHTLTSNL